MDINNRTLYLGLSNREDIRPQSSFAWLNKVSLRISSTSGAAACLMYRICLFPKAFTKVSCLAASSPVVISLTHQFSLFSFVISENSCFIHSKNEKIRFLTVFFSESLCFPRFILNPSRCSSFSSPCAESGG